MNVDSTRASFNLTVAAEGMVALDGDGEVDAPGAMLDQDKDQRQ